MRLCVCSDLKEKSLPTRSKCTPIELPLSRCCTVPLSLYLYAILFSAPRLSRRRSTVSPAQLNFQPRNHFSNFPSVRAKLFCVWPLCNPRMHKSSFTEQFSLIHQLHFFICSQSSGARNKWERKALLFSADTYRSLGDSHFGSSLCCSANRIRTEFELS